MSFVRNVLMTGMMAAILCACGNEVETPKNAAQKLDASLINNPHTANADPAKSVEVLATMDFVDTSYDFGTMHEGESSSYDFKFTNNGKSPLLISNAAGTCGCTVPDYPRSPIAPGESGVINVKFNSTNKEGLQNKAVNIFTNSNKGTHKLHITADVK